MRAFSTPGVLAIALVTFSLPACDVEPIDSEPGSATLTRLFFLDSSEAADTVWVSSSPACGGCRIEVAEQPIVLGGPDDPEILGNGIPHVQRRPDGTHFLLEWGAGDVVIRFDSAGAFEGLIGRPGEGPGEFRDLAHLVLGSSDSLWVFDQRNGVIRFAPSGTYGRQFRSPSTGEGAVRLSTGDFIVAGIHRTSDGAGYPLLHLSGNGEQVAYFGLNGERRLDPRDLFSLVRRITPSKGASVWSVPLLAYVVEEWDAGTHARRRILARDAAWFPMGVDRERPEGAPPLPGIDDIRYDPRTDYLWVLVQIAVDTWQPLRTSGPVNPNDQNERYATIIEVIDASSGELVASQRTEVNAIGWAGDGAFYTWREDALGYRFVDIWKVHLVNESGL